MDKAKLAANYTRVLERGAEAAARAGRGPDGWRLVAVTKTVHADVAAALAFLGATDFGENRVAGLLEKRAALADLPVIWHFVGHLQTNKVKKVVGAVSLIHSVDSVRLAAEIDKAAAAAGVVREILLEANVSGEEAKYGLSPAEVPSVAADVAKLPHVKLVGLMTMAPIADDPERARPVFRGLRELADKIAAARLFARLPYELSMGMTQDFEVAIEEGATLIRVGSALFAGV